MNSVLLLVLRPSSVSLDAIGFDSPNPFEDTRVPAIPLSINASATDLALASDSF